MRRLYENGSFGERIGTNWGLSPTLPTLALNSPRQTRRPCKMRKKKLIGITFGTIAGVLDVIPMIVQKLSWDANISAFSMWVVVGLIISSIDFNMPSIVKGIVVSFLILLPTAILIGWKDPFILLPISAMTLLLGGGLGFAIDNQNN